MGLSSRIFIGLFAGVAVGLFFGEMTGSLKIFGDVFIMLLQMTVLPYIVVSLTAGFGRMGGGQVRKLALRGSLVLLIIWAIALAVIFLAPLAFPEQAGATFFGSPAAPVVDKRNPLELYLPANVFYSLSNNLVPAVVLFSILLGVGLISVRHENKTSLLSTLDGFAEALGKVNHTIVQLTPYGIFAIAAAAAGTMSIEEVGRVQVYLVTYISVAVLSTLWIFPGLVAAVSGLSYRDVLSSFKEVLVTAFATGNQFVVLPQIAQRCKELLNRNRLDSDECGQAVDVIVPITFNFPSLGKLLVLLFVLFAAWFSDRDLSAAERLQVAGNGLLSLFGSINVAVPQLLDELRIPADLFQLFLVTGVVVGRFGAMLAALHIIVVSLLGALALEGKIQLRKWRILGYLAGTVILTGILLGVLRFYFTLFVPDLPPREEFLAQMQMLEGRVEATVFEAVPERKLTRLEGSRLDRILERGALRVGYRPANLPCSYLNADGRLVGFDVEMAHLLARDLGVELEFIPFEFEILGDMLNSGQIDIAMSCIASLPDRQLYASFSSAYLDLTLGLVVPDPDRHDFQDIEALRDRKDLTVAVVGSDYFIPRLRRLVPHIKVVTLERAEDFFSAPERPADALILSLEEGAAYSYRYPAFTAIAPGGKQSRLPAAYPVPKGDAEMLQFINNWIDLKRKEGVVDELYGYWMLGGVSHPREPRWSIIRDVLHWVD